MNAAPSLAPDIRACAIERAPRENNETRVRTHPRSARRCTIDLGVAKRGSKQPSPKRGANINARERIAGQSTAQK
jgi:hypothetical protein